MIERLRKNAPHGLPHSMHLQVCGHQDGLDGFQFLSISVPDCTPCPKLILWLAKFWEVDSTRCLYRCGALVRLPGERECKRLLIRPNSGATAPDYVGT